MRRRLTTRLVVAACIVAVAWATPVLAQHRGPGPGPGGGAGPGAGAHPGPGPARPPVYGGGYYGPYFGPYFYSPWFYAGFWYGGPYGWGYPYLYGVLGASVKVQVEPKNAEVYVDGHLAGIVDRFDGFLQSLDVEPGGREITIYLEGYRPIVQRLYLSVGSTYKIRGTMEKLAPGEQNEPRPMPAAGPIQAQPTYQEPPAAAPSAGSPPEARPGEAAPAVAVDAAFGQVAIRVQPAGAEIAIDGELWQGPQGADRLVVHLPAGMHRVAIRKDGFDPFVTTIEIRKGEIAALNVSLAKL